jgi:FMN phosphatase YigB (HAD superfamily)
VARKHKLRLLLVDFDGVMSTGRFYQTNNDDDTQLGRMVGNEIFANSANHELVRDWMCGRLSYQHVHSVIAKELNVEARLLDELLVKSVKAMTMSRQMIDYIQALRQRGVVVSLFTDNMDIFDQVAIAYHKLHNYFDYIYSSSTHGSLKLEDMTLLEKAMRDAGVKAPVELALVDDAPHNCQRVEEYGGRTFLYPNGDTAQAAFESWLTSTYTE